MKKLEIGDIVEHRVHTAKRWGFGIVKKYRRYHGVYEILRGDGTVRTHTSELLKQIA